MHTVSANSCCERLAPESSESRAREFEQEREQAGQIAVVRRPVYDPVLRIVHAWNATLILGLLFTAETAQRWFDSATTETLWRIHVWLGLGLIMGVVARIAWGWVGPKHARLSDLWHPSDWKRMLITRQWFSRPRRFGHHPEASLAYIGLYVVLVVMIASGLVLAALEQNMGPLLAWGGYGGEHPKFFADIHGLLEKVVLFYVVIHLGAMILHWVLHGTRVAQSMVTGYQYLRRGK